MMPCWFTREQTAALLDAIRADGYVVAPWQLDLIERHLEADAKMMGRRP